MHNKEREKKMHQGRVREGGDEGGREGKGGEGSHLSGQRGRRQRKRRRLPSKKTTNVDPPHCNSGAWAHLAWPTGSDGWCGEEMASWEDGTCTSPVMVINEIQAMQEEIFANRRWFHAHPELSFEEIQTAAKVVEILRDIGIDEIWEGVGRTGVVAVIRGGKPGKCIALRADMDALPIQETSDLPFKSQNDGVMHACGHDGHMSGLLAAAKVIFAERSSLSGSSISSSPHIDRCCKTYISTC